MAIGTNATIRAAILALDPIAYYPMDDATGSAVLRDHSIFRHHATLSGSYTLEASDNPTGSGKSVAATGTGSAVHTLSDAELHLAACESKSFHHFLKPTNHVDFNQQAFQVVATGGTNFTYQCFARAADTAMYIGNGNSSGSERFGPSNSGLIANGTWGSVGYTRDYASSGAARIFKNGALFQGPTNKTGAYAPDIIRLLGNGTSNGLNGNACHAAWFDRKLSDAEMQTLYDGITVPTPGPIEYVATGAGASGASNAAVPYPTDSYNPLQAGDIIFLWAMTRDSSETVQAPSGFAAVGSSVTEGTGSSGEDSGSWRASLFYKISDGTETGTETVDTSPNSINNLTMGQMVAYRPPSGWLFDIASTSGADTSSGFSWSVTGAGSLDFAVDDMVLAFSAAGVRATTMHTQRVTASGVTFEQPHRSMLAVTTTGGNGFLSASDHLVTAGPGTQTPSFTADCYKSGGAGTNLRGQTIIVRLRAEPGEPDPPIEYGPFGQYHGAMIYGKYGIPWAKDDLTIDWCTLVADLEITCGPYTPLSNGTPHQLRMKVLASPYDFEDEDGIGEGNTYLDISREVWVMFIGPYGNPVSDSVNPDLGSQVNDGPLEGEWGRCLFHGKFGQVKQSVPGDGFTQLAFAGEDSQFFNERNDAAASHNSIRDVATAISALSDAAPLGGNDFPDDTVLGVGVYHSASQDRETNGAHLEKSCQGYGIHVVCEWDITTAIEDDEMGTNLYMRPSIFIDEWNTLGSSDRRADIVIEHAYMMGYADVGRDYGQFPNRVTVAGDGPVGDFSGVEGLGLPAVLGYNHHKATGWWTDDTICAWMARNILNLTGFPHTKIFKLVVPLDLYHQEMLDTGMDSYEAEKRSWLLGACRVGDLITFKTETFGGSDYPFPGEVGYAGQKDSSRHSDAEITAIVAPYVDWSNSYADPPGTANQRVNVHRIHGFRKTYNKVQGWMLELVLAPHNVDHTEGLEP